MLNYLKVKTVKLSVNFKLKISTSNIKISVRGCLNIPKFIFISRLNITQIFIRFFFFLKKDKCLFFYGT